MIIEIIKHTPIWVFILFAALLFLGYSQTKNREIKLKRIFILPMAMILLSIFGIFSAFGMMPTALTLWFLGGGISLIIGLKLSFPRDTEYDDSKKIFYIPGSWIPMFLILIIFFTKYLIGVIVARQLPIINQIEFIVVISLLYGLISGIFLSRSIVMLKSKNK